MLDQQLFVCQLLIIICMNTAQTGDPEVAKGIDESSNDTVEGLPSEDLQKINNLNTNIDDLFSRIMKLTSEVESDLAAQPTTLPSIQFPITPTLQYKKYELKAIETKEVQEKKQEVPKQPQTLSMRHFQLGKQIGQGKFGIVYECKHIPTGMVLGLKKIYRSSIQQYGVQAQIQNEVTILSSITHPNILKLFGFFGDPYHVFIITEYLPGKSLEKMLKSGVGLVKEILYQLMLAIKCLHDLQIAHRDIKAENVMYVNGVVKLLDFGYATYIRENPVDTLCGTLDYASPEILEKEPYGLGVDLWALGILAYQLITGTVPLKADTIEQKRKLFKEKEIQYGSQIPEEARSLIQGLLKKNPKERISIDECLKHPFITSRSQEVTLIDDTI